MTRRRKSTNRISPRWRSAASATTVRTTRSASRQNLSRRKLLLETLESRQLLAVDGMGFAGDGMTDEYFNSERGEYAMNWVSLIGEHRSADVPLGELKEAPDEWDNVRQSGYEYNWARFGADSSTLLSQQQHTSLATDILEGDVSHAVLAIGQNDFLPGQSVYTNIYSGAWSSQQISNYSDTVFNNVRTAIETIDVNDVELVVSTIIDQGVVPAARAAYPNDTLRGNVTSVVAAINDRIEQFASERGIIVVDAFSLVNDQLSQETIEYGGVVLSNTAGQASNNIFTETGSVPHTIASSFIANLYLSAFNAGSLNDSGDGGSGGSGSNGGNGAQAAPPAAGSDQIPLFTEQEVLEVVLAGSGLNYVADTFGVVYDDYLVLPAAASATGPIPQELLLHSNPNSNFTIFLDFNGNITEGTSWNTSLEEPILVDAPAGISLVEIQQIWQILAEDFAPFDVDVTTEEPGAEALRVDGTDDTQWGVRVVISPDDTHNLCLRLLDETCGGIAGLESFNDTVDRPVYTFTSSVLGAADTSSHEVGHSLGLSHDGNGGDPAFEYYPGHDSGLFEAGFPINWLSIMGGGFGQISQWSNGTYNSATNGEDDLAIITTDNGFGYRTDDHQDSLAFATPLRLTDSNQVSFSGIIETEDDIDMFQFDHGGGRVVLDIQPLPGRPNLDVWAGIYDQNGDIYTYFDQFGFIRRLHSLPSFGFAQPEADPTLSASFDIDLPAGRYYLKVDGVGSHASYERVRDIVLDPREISDLYDLDPALVDPWTEDPAIGYSDYASLGQYWISGTVVPPSANTINIEATDAIKAEGNTDDETSFVFTLTRTGPTDGATNVDYIVIPALPTEQGGNYKQTVNGADFRSFGFPLGLPSGFATFEAGEATTEIAITVAGDTVYEPDEYFEVLLFEPIGETVPWTFENSSAVGIIESDENQFFIETPNVLMSVQGEGDDLGTSRLGAAYEFNVIRGGYDVPIDTDIRVPWRVDPSAFVGSATSTPASPTDFVNRTGNRFLDVNGVPVFPSGNLTFAPGETEKTVTVYARADRIFEMDESFQLVLGTPRYATTPTVPRPLSVHPVLSRMRGIIQNEDIVAAPTLTVETRIEEIYEEGDTILLQQQRDRAIATRVTVTRDGDILNNPAFVTVTLSGDNADDAFLMIGPPSEIDPQRSGPTSIDIPFSANQTVFDNLYVVSVDDDQREGPQLVTLIATADDHLTGTGTVVVQDDGTALDLYVAKLDDSYEYSYVDTIVGIGYTTYIIDMTSQTWRDITEVDKPEWQHWVQIVVPDNPISDTAVLVISGGSTDANAPTETDPLAVAFALQTNQITVILPTVPNQPLTFSDDPNNPRSEDAIIAYSYDKYLDGGDNEWPVLLPMVKSAVRAMDTAVDFLDDNTEQNIDIDIADFFVTGASKRGWTTWLTAAVDSRVVGIAPAVIDVLNMEVSMANHRENYEGVTERITGGYTDSVRDYTEFGVFDRFDTPEGRDLARIVDPYEYRDRYSEIPKYILNATGDQFFTPDSSLWYFDDLPGENYLWYVPNTDHRLNPGAFAGVANFFAAIDASDDLPEISWTFEGSRVNTLRVQSDITPVAVRLWQATNPESIDFRQETNAPPYTFTSLSDQGGGEYVGTVSVPTTGGTAFFVELTYFINGRTQVFTTQASIAEPPPPRLLAVTPGVSPNVTPDLSLTDLNVLDYAPQDLTFHFDPDQRLAPNLSGIQIYHSGGDDSFGDDNEVQLLPDSIEIQPDGYTIVATFAQPLAEERYRIVITGEDDADNGLFGLRNTNGDPFVTSDGGDTAQIDFDVSVILDFGDAPDSFGTLLANDGARHTIQPWQTPRLGPAIDSELDGQPSDNDDATGVDDEDGIRVGTLIDGASSFTVFHAQGADPINVLPNEVLGILNPLDPLGANVNIQVFGTGFLDAWIDFNQNDLFDPSERVLDSVAVSEDPDAGGIVTANVLTPAGALDGMTWMRVRISDTGNLAPGGLQIGGEVEDYQVEVISIAPLNPDDDAYAMDEDRTLDTLAQGHLSIADGDTIDPNTFISTDFSVDQGPANGSVTIDATSGHFVYQPNPDFTGTDSFTYRLGTLLTTPVGTVTITVNPINDDPTFDIDAPLVAGVATLNILEIDDGSAWTMDDFVINLKPGNPTSVDETAGQVATISISNIDDPGGIMAQPPELAQDGKLSLFPLPDAVGTVTYTVTASDDFDPAGTSSKTFVVNVQPVNDPPKGQAPDPPSATSNPDKQYSVANDGVITYTLTEDNTQPDGSTPSFFIPLQQSDFYIGLLDVLSVGAANEADDSPGGQQTLQLIDAGIGTAGPLVDRTTTLGGILSPEFDENDVLIGLNYVPPANFNSALGDTDSFTYTVRDNGKTYQPGESELVDDPLTATNQIVLVLNAVNDAPTFTMSTDQIEIREDDSVSQINNFVTDLVAEPGGSDNLAGLEFTFVPIDFDVSDMSNFFSSPPAIDPESGAFTFQTAANVFGEYEFDVVLNDGVSGDPARGDVGSTSQRLTISVAAQNDSPFQTDTTPLTFELPEEGSIEVPIIGVGGLLEFFVPGPAAMFANESANVTPGGNQSTSLVLPLPPNTALGGTLEVVNVGGQPSHFVYTPRPNFSGVDTLLYTVKDNGESIGQNGTAFADPKTSAVTRVTFVVSPINDAPVFSVNATVQSDEDQGPVAIEAWATNVLAGPASANDELSGSTSQSVSFLFTQVGGDQDLIVPGSLSATLNSVTGQATLNYETATDRSGSASFEVRLQDDGPNDAANGDQNTSGPRPFTIEVAALNDPPSLSFISNDPVTSVEDNGPFSTGLLTNISPGPADESSQTVSFEVQPLAAEYADLFSSLPTIDANGVLQFTTAPDRNTDNINGPVPVRILARDSLGADSGLFGFEIQISEVNDRPIAVGDSIETDEDTILTIDASSLLANDIDPDRQSNANEELSIRLPLQPLTSSGAQLLYDVQTGKITYDPTLSETIQALAPGQARTDTFTYSLVDSGGLVSNAVTVTLNVAGINDAPRMVLDTPRLEPSGATVIRVLDNDSDIDGAIDPSSVEIVLQPAFGTISVTSEGVIIYTPFGAFTGVDKLSYTVKDDLGLVSAPSIVTISSNASPIVRNDAAGTFLGEAIQIDVAANDEDSDGLDLTSIVVTTQPRRGEAIERSDGTVLYVPDSGFIGTDSFTYQISDNLGRSSGIATVTIQVVASRLQNPARFGDVNADGHVTALDALLVINRLHSDSNASGIPVLSTDRGPNFYDVSGNQIITAQDALLVVNELARLNVEPEQPRLQAFEQPKATFDSDRSEHAIALESDRSAKISSSKIRLSKIIDTSLTVDVPRDVIDLIAQQRDSDDDDSLLKDSIDAAMADLI